MFVGAENARESPAPLRAGAFKPNSQQKAAAAVRIAQLIEARGCCELAICLPQIKKKPRLGETGVSAKATANGGIWSPAE
jgi:hypothetical protein